MANLTRDELSTLLRGTSGVTLAFDTNTIFGNSRRDPFLDLCDKLNAINNERLSGPLPPIRKVISAPVYAEKLQDLRAGFKRRNQAFDPSKIESFLSSKGIDVVDINRRHAEHLAEMLSIRYPQDGDWSAFKKRRCLDCLGLSPATKLEGTGQSCGAAVDWLVAGHADAESFVLVTNDTGPEFDSVRLKTELAVLVDVVSKILETSG
jgi:hypothetical protein